MELVLSFYQLSPYRVAIEIKILEAKEGFQVALLMNYLLIKV